MLRDAPAWQQGSGDSAAAAVVAVAAWRQRSAWQRGGGVKLGIRAAQCCVIAASLGHGHTSCHQCRAATVRCRGGDEDTGSDSDGGGTNNQQSTKNTETAAMAAPMITMETKGTAVAAEAR